MYYSDQVILYFVCLILFISGQNAATRSIFNQDSEIQLLGKGIMRKNGQAEEGPGGPGAGIGGPETGGACVTFLIVFWAFTN